METKKEYRKPDFFEVKMECTNALMQVSTPGGGEMGEG